MFFKIYIISVRVTDDIKVVITITLDVKVVSLSIFEAII